MLPLDSLDRERYRASSRNPQRDPDTATKSDCTQVGGVHVVVGICHVLNGQRPCSTNSREKFAGLAVGRFHGWATICAAIPTATSEIHDHTLERSMRHCGYADERVPPRFGSMIRTPPPRRWRRDLFAHCVCLRWKLRAVGREPSQKNAIGKYQRPPFGIVAWC